MKEFELQQERKLAENVKNHLEEKINQLTEENTKLKTYVMRLVVKQYLEWEKLTGQKLDPHLYIDNHYFDNIPLPDLTCSFKE